MGGFHVIWTMGQGLELVSTIFEEIANRMGRITNE